MYLCTILYVDFRLVEDIRGLANIYLFSVKSQVEIQSVWSV